MKEPNLLLNFGMKPLSNSVPVRRDDVASMIEDMTNEATSKAQLAEMARHIADHGPVELRLDHLQAARRFEHDATLYMEWVGILESWIE